MCLGIPMRILEIDGTTAVCEAKGVERTVDLFLMQDAPPAPGEHVMVHSGQALQRMSADEARETWALLDQLLAAEGDGALS
jgi:hydrogenase expression/formation protein HypC